MATKKTTKTEQSSTGTALQPWEQRMAEKAAQAAETAQSTGGSSPSIGTRGGVFTIDGAEVEGNVLQVVILDFVVDVTYYESDFDPDDITPPTAFALGRNEKTLEWHEDSHPDFAGQPLKDSPVFQWGSADKGRGKAAKSRRRLMVISSDDLEEDVASAEVRKLTVPVTSGKEFDAYVKQLKVGHNRAPCGVLTEIRIKPHPKYQFELKFKMLGLVEDEVMSDILDKVDSIEAELFTPYAKWDSAEQEENAKPSKAVGRSSKPAKPARGRGR